MDQRRVFLFLFLSFMVLVINSMLFPPQRPPRELPPEVAVDQPADEPVRDQRVRDERVDRPQLQAPDTDAVDDPAVDAAIDAVEEDELAELELAEEAEPELTFATLGSLDVRSPYRMLVTFTSEGAGVKRVELASPRFRDLHDRGGYLGHLELAPHEDGGLLIQVVGTATPAEKAGLEVGDRIVSATINSRMITIDNTAQLQQILARSQPRAKLTLNYLRDGETRATDVTLGRRPLEVMRPESENVALRTGQVPAGFVDYPSYLMTIGQIDGDKVVDDRTGEIAELEGVNLRDANWEITDQDEVSITFRRVLPQRRLEVVKRYWLERAPEGEETNPDFPAYGLQMDLTVRNLSGEKIDLAYHLDGPNGLPIEGWWYAHKIGRNWSGAGLRDVLGRYYGHDTAEQSPTTIAEGKAVDFEGRSMAWVGVDAQFFASMMIPIKESVDEKWIDIVRPMSLGPALKGRGSDGRFANVTTRLMSIPFAVGPQETLSHSYNLFIGPKRPELLSQYRAWDEPRYSLSDVMYYGWFGTVAKAMLGILHFFYGLVHNYGIAIILLTVLVRSCLFPLSRKQALSMARMQELRPEMERIKEKYKSDMQKQSQAMQEMYRKHKINPLSGCLPMFIQLPIFLGLYRALMVDVELRQAPLFSDAIRFCSDLAAPDRLLDWSPIMPAFITSGDGLFSPGPYLNILPLITVGLFIVQQKMFMPEPTNEQAALQQKMMKYMMMFMAILFYKVASGLCIYFIASSLWGICERKMLPKITMPDLPGMGGTTPTKTDKKPSPRPGSNGAPKSKKSRQKKKR